MTFATLVQICLDRIKQAKANLIYLLGADDAGKTTLAKELANQLILKGKKVAIIDADPGQSSRLPLTLSLNYANKQFNDLCELVLADWDFMPSYNLLGCFQRYIKLVERWARKAKEEMDYCIVDSNGDSRQSLKLREIEILSPDLVIALQRKAELEPILKSLGSRTLRLPVLQEVKRKSSGQRKEARNERLRLYFKDSSVQVIIVNRETSYNRPSPGGRGLEGGGIHPHAPRQIKSGVDEGHPFGPLPSGERNFIKTYAGHCNCKVPSDLSHRIVGLYSQGKFLGLGIAEGRNDDGLRVVTPVLAKVDKVEFSSVKFKVDCRIPQDSPSPGGRELEGGGSSRGITLT